MFKMIEPNQVATLIVKDMLRLGRNYIEVGWFTETILIFCIICSICKTASRFVLIKTKLLEKFLSRVEILTK